MKIAYLILAYTDPEHLVRLAQALEGDVFVHIDAKSDMMPFADMANTLEKGNLFFTTSRHSVYWGSYSVVDAIQEVMQLAAQHGPYDRYFHLFDMSYPVWPNNKIKQFIKENQNVEFIQATDISVATKKYLTNKNRRYWYFNTSNRFLRSFINRIILPFSSRKPHLNVMGNNWHVGFGAISWALTQPCFEYVLKTLGNPIVKKYFKYTYAPDEMVIPTIVFNSEFAANTVNKGFEAFESLGKFYMFHHCHYYKKMKIWQEEDFQQIIDSGKMFCRKMRTDVSFKLYEKLDEHIVAEQVRFMKNNLSRDAK